MPTLADFWRIRSEREAPLRKRTCMTFFEGPRSAMDRDDDVQIESSWDDD